MKIITSELIEVYKNRIFNIHPSLLPKFGGLMDMNVHEEILNSNEYLSGCTLHVVDEMVDSGRIILQKQYILDT